MSLLPIPPTTQDESIPVPKGLPSLPSLIVALSPRGGGKTYTISRLLRRYMDAESLTHLFGIVPTYHSNRETLEWAGLLPEHAYTDITQGVPALTAIIQKCKALHGEYKRYLAIRDAYMAYKQGRQLTPHEAYLVESTGGKLPPEVKAPRPCIIVDDCMYSKFITSKEFANFCIKHRHVGFNPRMAVSCVIMCQALKGSIPRGVRSNIQVWAVWGPSHDVSQMKDIWSELSGRISYEHFLELYDYSVSKPYGYLVIDTTSKYPFRDGFGGKPLTVA